MVAVIAALADGKLGYHSEHVPPSTFPFEYRPVVEAVLEYRKATAHWPTRHRLPAIVPETAGVQAEEIMAVDEALITFITPKALTLIKTTLLRELAKIAAEQSGFAEPNLNDLDNRLENIRRLGEPPATPFDFMTYATETRWLPDEYRTVSPIPLPAIAEEKPGLKAGEHGLIMAPTKRGKSFVSVWLALQAMKAGLDVIYITLELTPEELTERFLRGLIGNPLTMDHETYRQKCIAFDGRLPDIRSFPPRSIGTGMVKDICRRKHNEIGSNFVCFVDYGYLLRPSGSSEARHQSLGDIHLDLCGIAKEYRIPLWSPFQTNRSGALEEEGDLSTGHAGSSYEAMTHVDLVMALQQSPNEEAMRKMRIRLAASRSSGGAESTVVYDWNRMTIEQVTYGPPTSDPAAVLSGPPLQ